MRDFGLRNQKCQNRLHSNNESSESFVMLKFMFQRYSLKYSFLNQIAGFFNYQYLDDDDDADDDNELFLWYG